MLLFVLLKSTQKQMLYLCAFRKHTKANLSLLGKARLPVALTVLTSPSHGDEIVLCFCVVFL